jgi:two-component system, NarL family, nitrate/nitrite response regulator NarL
MSIPVTVTATGAGQRQHVLLSKNGSELASWARAFPTGQSIALDQIQTFVANNVDAIIWLRLYAPTAEESNESNKTESKNAATIAAQIDQVRQHFARQALIVMSDIPHDLEALAVFTKGARGYCNAHAGEQVLTQIAAVVEQGGLWIGESIMQLLITKNASSVISPVPQPSNTSWKDKLTERETQVAQAIANGASNREIANQLGITERTVKAHVGAILDKCEVRDRLQLGLLVRADFA